MRDPAEFRGAVAALLAGLTLLGPAARAQRRGSEEIARTFELRARAGMDRQLDDGYRRHLEWHTAAGDRWTWYLWEVADGDRAGLYVDGTFGHRWGDFDAAVAPPGDRADNALNVNPFAVRFASQVWRLREDLSGATVDHEAAPLVLRREYHVGAGAEGAFLAALRRFRADVGARPLAIYELVSGGEGATYVVWVPAATWAEAGEVVDRTAEAARALAAGARHTRLELWRFRPDLSSCRRAAARCHATLAAR